MEEPTTTEAIEATLHAAARAVERGDVDGVLDMFHDDADVVIMDYAGPCRIDLAQLRTNFTALAGNTVGSPICRYVEIHVTSLAPDAAFSWAVMQYVAQMRDGEKIDLQARVTDVWSLIDGKWLAVHEHGSFPVDPDTGQPNMHACSQPAPATAAHRP